MLRSIIRNTSDQDPIAEAAVKLELLKQSINSKPFSPVKKRVMTAYINYWAEKLNNIGFFSAMNVVITAEQKLYTANEIANLLKRTDDEFISGMKVLVQTMPPESKLRTVLARETEAAERDLQSRRASVHEGAKWAALSITLGLMARSPMLGMAAFCLEVFAILSTDVNRLFDSALELYDCTGYTDVKVDGQVTRKLMTSYPPMMNNPETETVTNSFRP